MAWRRKAILSLRLRLRSGLRQDGKRAFHAALMSRLKSGPTEKFVGSSGMACRNLVWVRAFTEHFDKFKSIFPLGVVQRPTPQPSSAFSVKKTPLHDCSGNPSNRGMLYLGNQPL